MTVSLSASEKQGEPDKENIWYQDSGATHHMTGNLNWMTDVKPLDNPIKIKLGDSSMLKSKCIGNVRLQAYDGNKWYSIVLKEVLFVPELTFNLFSLTTALDKGYEEHATLEKSIIMENNNPVLMSDRDGGLFKMRFKEMQEYNLSAVSIKVWHERLAHQNVEYVRKILKKNNVKFVDDWNNYFCTGCAYGKQCRISHKINPIVSENCLDLIHVDLGEMNELSLGGAKYFLLFKDDYSHFRTVYFLKNKSEAVDKLNVFLNLVENQFDKKVKKLKSDNGTEIKNTRSKEIFEDLGILHQRSATYTPQQNGRAEREMRTIVEAARAGIYAKELGKRLWAEALNYSVFTINQTGTSTEKSKSPAELWFGRKVSIKTLKQFGCECFILKPDHQRKKLDKKSYNGVFVGYDVEEQGYRVYVPEKQRVEVSCNVLFKENFDFDSYSTEINLNEINACQENKTEKEETATTEENSECDADGQEESENEDMSYDSAEEPSEDEFGKIEHVPTPSDRKISLRDRKKIKPPERFGFYSSFIGEVENMSVEEALQDNDWKASMEDEINSLMKMDTWTLTDLPKNRKALSCKWVFRTKEDDRKKARLVARGYDQKEGIDYYETFSPVARYASIRLILSHASKKNFYIETFDIKKLF